MVRRLGTPVHRTLSPCGLRRPPGPSSSACWPTRSNPVGRARAWWRGVSRSPPTSGPPSPTRTTGARPVAGFGDPDARLAVVGLAPAAHGGNRTGRVFTGDRSADWLVAALWRAGYANQPTSTSIDDGLAFTGAWMTAAVRCAPPANKPTPDERDRCLPFLVRELALLDEPGGDRGPGRFAYQVVAGAVRVEASAQVRASGRGPATRRADVVCSYHPSQQNTFTGVLTEPMFDAVFARATNSELNTGPSPRTILAISLGDTGRSLIPGGSSGDLGAGYEAVTGWATTEFRRQSAGHGHRRLRPAPSAHLRQLPQEGDGTGVLVTRPGLDGAVGDHRVEELPSLVGAHDGQRPVVEGADAPGGDVGVLGGEIGAGLQPSRVQAWASLSGISW